MDVNGKNQQSVLTGQVCAQHRSVPHDAAGDPEHHWCNSCGRNDKGERLGTANGGWGT